MKSLASGFGRYENVANEAAVDGLGKECNALRGVHYQGRVSSTLIQNGDFAPDSR